MANLAPIILNGVYSTVQTGSTAIGSASATGINVATGDGSNFGTIGTDQYIAALIVDPSTNPETIKEYVWVTARSTDTLTVVRQAEESTRFAASTTTIQAGYTIAAIPTASTLRAGPRGSVIGGSSGRYVVPGWFVPGASTWGTGVSAPINAVMFIPTVIADGTSFDRLSVNVTTALASSTIRLGIYASGGGKNLPGALITDAGTVSSATTGVKEATISWSPTPGLYYLAYAVSSTTLVCKSLPTTAQAPVSVANFSFGGGDFPVVQATSSGAVSGLPATAPSPDINLAPNNAWIQLRIA